MRLGKILGFGLLGTAAVAAILVLVLLWRLYVPSASAVRLATMYASRPQVPAAENAFIYLWGFPAPPGADPMELGNRRITWIQRKLANPGDISPDPLGEPQGLEELRSKGIKALVKACGTGPGAACVTAFDAWPAELAFDERESIALQRYRAMLAQGRWFEVVTFVEDVPLPPFAEVLDAQRLQMLALRQAVSGGDVTRVRDTLQADFAFWREVMSFSDTLISKMIACAAIRNHFFFGNLVLRRLPPARQAEAIPAGWRQPFSDAELSMFRVMAGEFEFSRSSLALMRAADADFEEYDDGEYTEDVVDEWLGRIGRQVRPWQRQLNQVADLYLGVAESFAVPLDQYTKAESGFLERFADDPSAKSFPNYAFRVGSLEGVRRAALLTAELRSRAVAASAVPGQLATATLKHPFTHAPFTWDAERQAVVYEGPEKHRWRRNLYFY